MTADQFNTWLADYRATYGPITDRGVAEKLGIHPDTLVDLKKRGAKRLGAVWLLALDAMIHNLKGYG